MKKIIKLLFSVILSILAAILIVSGLTAFTIPEAGIGWNIAYFIIGGLLAWLGIKLAKEAREKQE